MSKSTPDTENTTPKTTKKFFSKGKIVAICFAVIILLVGIFVPTTSDGVSESEQAHAERVQQNKDEFEARKNESYRNYISNLEIASGVEIPEEYKGSISDAQNYVMENVGKESVTEQSIMRWESNVDRVSNRIASAIQSNNTELVTELYQTALSYKESLNETIANLGETPEFATCLAILNDAIAKCETYLA